MSIDKNDKPTGKNDVQAALPALWPRKLGILKGKASFVIAPDFKMTDEEFLKS